MKVSLVKVNGILWSGEAESVIAPGAEGEMTILKGHVPLVTTLAPGEITVRANGEELFTQRVEEGGVLEVTGKRVTVLL